MKANEKNKKGEKVDGPAAILVWDGNLHNAMEPDAKDPITGLSSWLAYYGGGKIMIVIVFRVFFVGIKIAFRVVIAIATVPRSCQLRALGLFLGILLGSSALFLGFFFIFLKFLIRFEIGSKSFVRNQQNVNIVPLDLAKDCLAMGSTVFSNFEMPFLHKAINLCLPSGNYTLGGNYEIALGFAFYFGRVAKDKTNRLNRFAEALKAEQYEKIISCAINS